MQRQIDLGVGNRQVALFVTEPVACVLGGFIFSKPGCFGASSTFYESRSSTISIDHAVLWMTEGGC